jgi:hypothetical protein
MFAIIKRAGNGNLQLKLNATFSVLNLGFDS